MSKNFDLEKAIKVLEDLESNEYCNHQNAIEEFDNSIDEINRLNRKLIKSNQFALDLQHKLDDYAKTNEQQFTRIEKLESKNNLMQAAIECYIAKQELLTTLNEIIKRLQKALIEARSAQHYYESIYHRDDFYYWGDYPEDACQCKRKRIYRDELKQVLASEFPDIPGWGDLE